MHKVIYKGHDRETGRVLHSDKTVDFPQFYTHFQDLADITALVWAYYHLRMKDGIPPVVDSESESLQPFDLKKMIEHTETNADGARVLYNFATGVRDSFTVALAEFFDYLRLEKTSINELPGLPPRSAESQAFLDGLSHDFFLTAQEKGQEMENAHLFKQVGRGDFPEGYSLFDDLRGGMGTGALAVVQMKAIFGDEFKIHYADWLAKTNFRGVSRLLAGIGLGDAPDLFEDSVGVFFDLLDGKTGFDHTKLMEAGLDKGQALGCVAFLKPREDIRSYLAGHHLETVLTKETVGKNFTEFVAQRVDEGIRKPFQSLPESYRSRISPIQRQILEGKLWKTVKEGVTHPSWRK